MSAECYRVRELEAPSLPSIRGVEGVNFLYAPRFKSDVCRDMYGDLPYGLFVVSNASVRGEYGYLFHKDQPLLEQNADFLRHKKFLRPRFDRLAASSTPSVSIDELVSLVSRRHHCFWHWMMDSLPKVLLAEESGFHGSYLIPSPAVAPWAAESLSLVGITADRLLNHEGHDLSVSRLSIPTYFCGYNAHHNLSFIQSVRAWIRSCVAGTSALSKQRVFVSRQRAAPARQVVNQEELCAVASDFGFQSIFFETLSLREQIALASASEAMIGGHGSGLTHALFMEERSLIIELFPYQRRQTNDCYERLSTIPLHRYYPLESENDCESHIEISGESLCAALTRSL